MTLLCRFDPVAQLPNITYYWVRTTESEVENVAFGELTLQSAYRYIATVLLLKRSERRISYLLFENFLLPHVV